MSTYYYPLSPLPLKNILSSLKELNLKEDVNSATNEKSKCLTDGQNYLWIYGSGDGNNTSYARYGSNNVEDIIYTLANHFNIGIVDEHEFDEEE